MKTVKNPKSLLIINADYLVTMDKKRRILRRAAVYCEGSKIKEVGSKRKKADRIIDASGMIMLPGFINTHHHLFQTLFRGIDVLKKQSIVPWVKTTAELTKGVDEEAMYTASLTGLTELLLSGCTTSADFLYLFPQGKNNLLKATIEAARIIGIRLHQVRGYVEKKEGNTWPDDVTQDSETILKESVEAIRKFHDPSNFSMCQIALGPCGFYSTSKELFAKICQLARKKGVRLHTHFAETNGEKICLLKEAGFLGKDVWLAHVIYAGEKEMQILAETETKVAYCPICNMAKKQPAPVIQMAKKGIIIGIGVDGSASNDSSNILIEARFAGRLQGLNNRTSDISYLRATQILEMLTLGGAGCLGREKSLGSIEVGKAADLVLIDISKKIECAGAHNPLEAIFHSGLSRVDYTIVNGRIIVEKGELKTVNLSNLVKKQNILSKKLILKAEKRLGFSFILPWSPLLNV